MGAERIPDRPFASRAGDGPSRTPSIAIWDGVPARLDHLAQILAQSVGACRVVDAAATVRGPLPRGCVAAIVALGQPFSSRAESLEVIRHFRDEGLIVVAYEHGVSALPVGAQCLPLVVGAHEVLDSAESDFDLKLINAITSRCERAAAASEQAEHLRTAMKQLGLVASCSAMVNLFEVIVKVASFSELPVLISGETGTGKEKVARAIHRLDARRARGPFVAVNCAAISPALAESELFGHKRGSFTGAERDRKGWFRAAHGGVLFLDELGELDRSLQSKLLRVLQEGSVVGVGEDEEVPVDVRVVAATNKDLGSLVAENRFREDLYHRLNVMPLRLPPLRERAADISPLVEHFVLIHGKFLCRTIPRVLPEFVGALCLARLAGNVRELENVVKRALIMTPAGMPLSLASLPDYIQRELVPDAGNENEEVRMKTIAPVVPTVNDPAETPRIGEIFEKNSWRLDQCLDQCEKLLLQGALKRSFGNQSQTARLMGITARSIYNKIRKYHLEVAAMGPESRSG